jgi:hypothetical protein
MPKELSDRQEFPLTRFLGVTHHLDQLKLQPLRIQTFQLLLGVGFAGYKRRHLEQWPPKAIINASRRRSHQGDIIVSLQLRKATGSTKTCRSQTHRSDAFGPMTCKAGGEFRPRKVVRAFRVDIQSLNTGSRYRCRSDKLNCS